MKWVWLSGPFATFVVGVDADGTIVKPAPICWKWKLRPIQDVIDYFKITRIEELNVS